MNAEGSKLIMTEMAGIEKPLSQPAADLVDVIQCPNCWQIVRLPEPIRVPHSGELNAFQRTWVPPRVPAHDCAHCTGGWDCPRDINWEVAGMRGPCTEEHEDVDGPLVIGFPQ